MDPLKKHHADNFNIKPHEGNDTAIRRNFVHQKLVDLINYIKNALKNIAYTINPKSHPKYIHGLGKDIVLSESEDHGHEIVNKEMHKLFDKAKSFFDKKTPHEIIVAFAKQASKTKRVFDLINNLKLMNELIREGKIPGVTQDEIIALDKLRMFDKSYVLSEAFRGNTLEPLSLRDIKSFYNVLMKCMNYAIKNEPEKAVQIAKSASLFDDKTKPASFKGKTGMALNLAKMAHKSISRHDKDIFRQDADFKLLMQDLEDNIDLNRLAGPMRAMHAMAKLALQADIKDTGLVYRDALIFLQQISDKIKKATAKYADGKYTKLEYDKAMFNVAREMGFINNIHTAAMKRYFEMPNFSENDFKRALLMEGIAEKFDNAVPIMERFPSVVDRLLQQVDANLEHPLSHTIDTYVN